MFERFTDRARRVVVLAQEEARTLSHNYIGTEHILLGLVREGEGVAAKSLEALGVSLEAVRQQVQELIGTGKEEQSGHIPFTPRAKKVLELSLREALQLGHNYIGTEHILLGLVREGEGVAAQVLIRLGADLSRVREQVTRILRQFPRPEPGPVEEAQFAGQAGSAGRRERAQLARVMARLRAVESRLSAVEQRTGTGPDVTDLDREIASVRSEKQAAVEDEDYEKAARLRDREKQLAGEMDSRRAEWAAQNPDLSALAEQVRQLAVDVERMENAGGAPGAAPSEGSA